MGASLRGGVRVPEVRSNSATHNSVLDAPFAAVDNFGVAADFGEVFGH